MTKRAFGDSPTNYPVNEPADDRFGNYYNLNNSYQDRRTKKEKMASVAIIFCGLLAVFLGYYVTSDTLRTPIWSHVFEDNADTQTQTSDQTQAMLDLANKDTDQDGLSDYEEMYRYSTSPYLEDSDSDGLTDKQEIDIGKDPNCPGNQNCFRQDQQYDLSNDQQTGLFSGQALGTGQNQTSNNDIFPQEDINQLNIQSIDDLRNLSGAQIRSLLMTQITDESQKAMLDQISDEDLKAFFLEQLDSQLNNYQGL